MSSVSPDAASRSNLFLSPGTFSFLEPFLSRVSHSTVSPVRYSLLTLAPFPNFRDRVASFTASERRWFGWPIDRRGLDTSSRRSALFSRATLLVFLAAPARTWIVATDALRGPIALSGTEGGLSRRGEVGLATSVENRSRTVFWSKRFRFGRGGSFEGAFRIEGSPVA